MLFATDAVLERFFNDPAMATRLIDIGRQPLRLIGLGAVFDGFGFS